MRVPLLLSTLVLAGLALLTARPAAATTRWGPPLLCHPFVIGEAESLPWGAGAFAVPDDLTPDRAAVIALEVLAEGDDLIVHLETLRRAAIALLYTRSEEPLAVERAQRFHPGTPEHQGGTESLFECYRDTRRQGVAMIVTAALTILEDEIVHRVL